MLGYIISDKQKINVEEYEIQSFDILHKTDLNIFVIENNNVVYKNNIVNIVDGSSFHGHIQVLEWFKKSGYEFKYDEWAIFYASEKGHVQVLEWFKNSGYEFKYNKNAINSASKYGHIQVLEWFKNSDYEFKYNEEAINCASDKGHIKVLEWFKNSGYEFKYTKNAFKYASRRGHIQVLEWFKNNNYKFKYNKIALKTKFIKILKFYSKNINIKKIIKWSSIIFIKTIKFKTHHKYLKGYQKN
jgi:hypothetical protein